MDVGSGKAPGGRGSYIYGTTGRAGGRCGEDTLGVWGACKETKAAGFLFILTRREAEKGRAKAREGRQASKGPEGSRRTDWMLLRPLFSRRL